MRFNNFENLILCRLVGGSNAGISLIAGLESISFNFRFNCFGADCFDAGNVGNSLSVFDIAGSSGLIFYKFGTIAVSVGSTSA